MARPVAILALVLVSLAAPMAASALSYSAIVAFGDSLTDRGNLGGIRFSDGPLWVEDLSSSLGLGAVMQSSSGGSDYAVAGSTTIDVLDQVSTFGSDTGGTADPNALYIVWAGANDVLNALQGGGTTDMSQAAQNVASAILTLSSMGAQNFLVPNLMDIGLTPLASSGGSAEVALAHQLSVDFDAALAGQLDGLAGVNLFRMDVYALFDDIVSNPAQYGLSDVTDPCSSGSNSCATSLFWDSVHPTAVGHALIAADALAALPEQPAGVLLVAAGMLGLGRRCRAHVVG